MPADPADAEQVDVTDRVAADAERRAAATAAALAAAAARASLPMKRRQLPTDSSSGGVQGDPKKMRENSSRTDSGAEPGQMETDDQLDSRAVETDAEADSCREDEAPWETVPSRAVKAQFQATRKAERAVRRLNRSSGLGPAGFEVDIAPLDESIRFSAENLLRVFCDIREVVREAQPRLNSRGGISVRVPQQSHIESLKTLKAIADVPVKLNLPSAASLWARVSGVHPAFSEKDLLTVLRPQGVMEVVREMYSASESTSTSENKRLLKPSNRLRIRFEGEIRPEVDIAHQVFKVTLCPASPLQCLACCGFGHRALMCPEKLSPRCRKCGGLGHQLWQCTARAKCVNCKGSHAANDSRCPVFAVYAKAAQERFVGKVVAGLDNVSVRQTAVLVPGVAPVPSVPVDGVRPSFASVVGKPETIALVRSTEEGERIVCYLPRPSTKRPNPVRAAKPKALPPQQSPKKPNVAPDNDALVAAVTAKVLESVSLSLDSIISRIVSSAIAAAVPRIVEAVTATLKATFSKPVSVGTPPASHQ
ncbi:uncharacterized protein LOC108865197 [Galendromus occidentalis]|uniref:Uncharacterized protein LOC108865197 n=1 Tax=Galendromus occidentalis TaxID=34638 RepID=A0AAJ7L8N9_9ACAR|nr:uncharacterized protein LOC108865197 [Galendromus occidentalis]